MNIEGGISSAYAEEFSQWRIRTDAALLEANRLQKQLNGRAHARTQNATSIEYKLSDNSLSARRRKILEKELSFLRTYDSRHPVGEAAVSKHIWIKFGMNIQEVRRQQAARR